MKTIAMILALSGTIALADTLAEGRAAVEKGLAWLAGQQNENGSFGSIPGSSEEGDVGITALVLKAFTVAPEDIRENYRKALERGASYLVAQVRSDGAIGDPAAGLGNYRTSLAIQALVALDPEGYTDIIARARDYVAGIQFHEGKGVERDNPHYGGFGYDRTNTRPDADMSNTQFALEALKDAGLDEDSEVFQRALVCLQRSSNSEANDLSSIRSDGSGGFFYDPGLSRNKSEIVENPDGTVTVKSYASMTYAGLLSMIYAGLSREDSRVQAAMDWIRSNYTLEENRGLGTRENPANSQQGLYYYYLTFARALDAYGEKEIVTVDGEAHHWAVDLVAKLCSEQKPEGFWLNEAARWMERDPVLVTAYACQSLGLALENLD